jgi:hypothetical protein
MSLYLPFGSLVSFHGDADDPAHQILFEAGKSTTPKPAIAWQTLYEVQENSQFPRDLRLLSRAPLKDPKVSYSYLLRADPTLEGLAAAMDIEVQYNALLAALDADYTLSGETYSGNVGWLRALTSDQVTIMKAWARIEDAAPPLEPGKNVYGLVVPLCWTLLEGPHGEQGFVADS